MIALADSGSARVPWKINEGVGVTPAMEAGVTGHVWRVEEIVGPLDQDPCNRLSIMKRVRLTRLRREVFRSLRNDIIDVCQPSRSNAACKNLRARRAPVSQPPIIIGAIMAVTISGGKIERECHETSAATPKIASGPSSSGSHGLMVIRISLPSAHATMLPLSTGKNE